MESITGAGLSKAECSILSISDAEPVAEKRSSFILSIHEAEDTMIKQIEEIKSIESVFS